MSCTMAVLILRVVCGVTQEWAYRQAVQNLLTQVTEAQATVTAVRNSYVSIVGAGAPTSPYVHAMTTEMHARLQTLLDAVATSLQNRLRADDPSTPRAWGVPKMDWLLTHTGTVVKAGRRDRNAEDAMFSISVPDSLW
eukprot:m.212800 g.212800  ORF g.212800 m.212800 type:complete len:138 (-) comp19051_c0_seq3:149-562(-)